MPFRDYRSTSDFIQLIYNNLKGGWVGGGRGISWLSSQVQEAICVSGRHKLAMSFVQKGGLAYIGVGGRFVLNLQGFVIQLYLPLLVAVASVYRLQ